MQPIYREQILLAQSSDIKGFKIRKKMEVGIKTLFRLADDGSLMLGQCLYVPDDKMIKQMVLQEAH